MMRTVGSALLLTAVVALTVVEASKTRERPAKPAAAVAGNPGTAEPGMATAAKPDSAAVIALLDGVANATCPMRGVASGGQVGEAVVAKLASSGFRTVLDLRAPDEARGYDEAAAVKKAGLEYVMLPVTKATLDDALFDRVRAFMQDADHHPVMVHCASGNRVGVVLLPWLVLDRGWSLERALDMTARGGTHEGPMKDQALAYIEHHQAGK